MERRDGSQEKTTQEDHAWVDSVRDGSMHPLVSDDTPGTVGNDLNDKPSNTTFYDIIEVNNDSKSTTCSDDDTIITLSDYDKDERTK